MSELCDDLGVLSLYSIDSLYFVNELYETDGVGMAC